MLDQLRALDKEAQRLKTDCAFRNAEIDNIRTPINLMIQLLEAGKGTYGVNAEDVMTNAQGGLQHLRENPKSAGSHEKFKVSI